jgi:hypothetical protein
MPALNSCRRHEIWGMLSLVEETGLSEYESPPGLTVTFQHCPQLFVRLCFSLPVFLLEITYICTYVLHVCLDLHTCCPCRQYKYYSISYQTACLSTYWPVLSVSRLLVCLCKLSLSTGHIPTVVSVHTCCLLLYTTACSSYTIACSSIPLHVQLIPLHASLYHCMLLLYFCMLLYTTACSSTLCRLLYSIPLHAPLSSACSSTVYHCMLLYSTACSSTVYHCMLLHTTAWVTIHSSNSTSLPLPLRTHWFWAGLTKADKVDDTGWPKPEQSATPWCRAWLPKMSIW